MDPKSHAAAKQVRSFYKIMLPSIINDHKLRIPEDFAKVYENELSSVITLIVPNDQVFRIKLEKSEKMLWLCKGWKEFSEHHSIRCGFFLVFDYEGNSNFKVHIFDLTATEIRYPNTSNTHEKPKNRSESSVLGKRGRKKISSVSIEDVILNECSLRGLNRKKCLHAKLQTIFQFAPEFVMTINKSAKCINVKSLMDHLRSNCQYQTRNKRHKLGDLGERTSSRNANAPKETSKAIPVFNSPENHETLVVEISKLPNKSVLQSDTCSTDRKSQQFSEDTESATQINKGEHCVKVKQEEGEELISLNDTNVLSTRSTAQRKENAVNAALLLKLNNPYFMSILKKQNVDLSFILNVPAYFGTKYLSTQTHYLKLEGPDGKQLQVSCFSNGKEQYLSRGWVTFVKKYKLVEGDVCIFELVRVDDEVLKVHIFHANQTSL